MFVVTNKNQTTYRTNWIFLDYLHNVYFNHFYTLRIEKRNLSWGNDVIMKRHKKINKCESILHQLFVELYTTSKWFLVYGSNPFLLTMFIHTNNSGVLKSRVCMRTGPHPERQRSEIAPQFRTLGREAFKPPSSNPI